MEKVIWWKEAKYFLIRRGEDVKNILSLRLILDSAISLA